MRNTITAFAEAAAWSLGAAFAFALQDLRMNRPGSVRHFAFVRATLRDDIQCAPRHIRLRIGRAIKALL